MRNLDSRIIDHAFHFLNQLFGRGSRDDAEVDCGLRRSGNHIGAETRIQQHRGDGIAHDSVQQRVLADGFVGGGHELGIVTGGEVPEMCSHRLRAGL